MHLQYIEQIEPGAEILYLNASSLKVAQCRRHYGMMVNGWIGDEGDTAIRDLGSAMHKFAEEFSRTGEHEESILAAIKAWPNVPRLSIIQAAARRADVVIPKPIYIDGQPLVEVRFSVPWLSVVHAGRHINIVLCGTMDHLGFADAGVRLIDYKTSSYAVIKYALDKYKYETQFKFYMWVLWKFGAHILPIEYFNPIREGKFSSQVCIIQVSAKEPRWYLDARKNMTEYEYDTYESTLRSTLPDLVQAYVDDRHAAPDGLLKNACQYCGYRTFCHAKSESDAINAANTFKQVEYNPIKDRS